MKRLIVNTILLGILFGAVGAVTTMLFGLIIYYAIPEKVIETLPYFLHILARTAVFVGLLISIGWYSYILLLVRKYIFTLLNRFLDREDRK